MHCGYKYNHTSAYWCLLNCLHWLSQIKLMFVSCRLIITYTKQNICIMKEICFIWHLIINWRCFIHSDIIIPPSNRHICTVTRLKSSQIKSYNKLTPLQESVWIPATVSVLNVKMWHCYQKYNHPLNAQVWIKYQWENHGSSVKCICGLQLWYTRL